MNTGLVQYSQNNNQYSVTAQPSTQEAIVRALKDVALQSLSESYEENDAKIADHTTLIFVFHSGVKSKSVEVSSSSVPDFLQDIYNYVWSQNF